MRILSGVVTLSGVVSHLVSQVNPHDEILRPGDIMLLEVKSTHATDSKVIPIPAYSLLSFVVTAVLQIDASAPVTLPIDMCMISGVTWLQGTIQQFAKPLPADQRG